MSFSKAQDKVYLQKDVEIQGDALFIANKTMQIDNLNTVSVNDFVFKRSGNNIMKLNTSNQLEFLGGNSKSVMYEETYFDLATFNVLRIRNTETTDNRIISFGVGATLDVLQITDTGISSAVQMTSTQFLSNSFDSNGNNDVVFNRNGVEFFRLQTSTPHDLINVETSKGLTSSQLYCNVFSVRGTSADLVFKCFDVANTDRVELMRLRRAEQDIQLTKPLFMNRQKLEFHQVASKEVFIDNFVESTVEVLQLRNNDTTGQIRYVVGGNTIIDMSTSAFNIKTDAFVEAGSVLEGELTDTSDKKKEYDIKTIEHNFSDIVKPLEPKTFKLNDEKEKGIVRNHIGLVADDLVDVIPKDFENIVYENNEGIKRLNYVKMSAILWGCVRDQQPKIEHLEASVYEMMEEIKELKGKTKPKPKAKAKSSTEK